MDKMSLSVKAKAWGCRRLFSAKSHTFDFGLVAPAPEPISSLSLELEFLGTSSARSTLTRNVSSLAVNFGGGSFLFDCGEGTIRQMLRSTVKPFDLRAVFLTHLHGDHCYGIPGLGMALLDQDQELLPWLVTPRGLEQCFTGPMGLRGFKVRPVQRPHTASTDRLDPAADKYEPVFFDKEKGCYEVYEDKQFKVKAVPIKHSVFCLGYVIEEKPRTRVSQEKLRAAGIKENSIVIGAILKGTGTTLPNGRMIRKEDIVEEAQRARKVVILGDTSDPSAIANIAMDADVLVHEATYTNDERVLAASKMHSTAGMAGAFARYTRARNLILTHFSPRNFGSSDLSECLHIRTVVEQAKKAFGSENVFPAQDYWRFSVPTAKRSWRKGDKGEGRVKDTHPTEAQSTRV